MDKQYQRLLTAAVGTPLLLLIFYVGGVWYLLFIIVIILLGQIELFKILGNRKNSIQNVIVLLLSVIMACSSYFGFFYVTITFVGVVLAILIIQLLVKDSTNVIPQIGSNLFGITYIGLFLSHAVLLRNIEQDSNLRGFTESIQHLRDAGFFYVVFVVACTFLNDTGAYYFGTWKGSRKLSPSLSPGKTVEGTCAGIIATIICGFVVNPIFGSPLSYYWVFIFSFIISIAAIFGDLVESMIKRSAGIKDSGSILPGHGGILDRFDSLIIVFPVSYYSILFYYSQNGVAMFL